MSNTPHPNTKTYVAYCESCKLYTSDRHTLESAEALCNTHNKNRDGCDATPAPVCWVCHDIATHQNQKPPYEYYCDEHEIGNIDAVPIADNSPAGSPGGDGGE